MGMKRRDKRGYIIIKDKKDEVEKERGEEKIKELILPHRVTRKPQFLLAINFQLSPALAATRFVSL
jgi:hypothetical protein